MQTCPCLDSYVLLMVTKIFVHTGPHRSQATHYVTCYGKYTFPDFHTNYQFCSGLGKMASTSKRVQGTVQNSDDDSCHIHGSSKREQTGGPSWKMLVEPCTEGQELWVSTWGK